MQYLVVARDGTDEDAVERRRRARPDHLTSIQPLVDEGHVLVGGAILSEAGDMVGSMLLVEFADRTELDRWIAGDPYVTEGVWEGRRCGAVPGPGRRVAAPGRRR